jgi:hypothetical protein
MLLGVSQIVTESLHMAQTTSAIAKSSTECQKQNHESFNQIAIRLSFPPHALQSDSQPLINSGS